MDATEDIERRTVNAATEIGWLLVDWLTRGQRRPDALPDDGQLRDRVQDVLRNYLYEQAEVSESRVRTSGAEPVTNGSSSSTNATSR